MAKSKLIIEAIFLGVIITIVLVMVFLFVMDSFVSQTREECCRQVNATLKNNSYTNSTYGFDMSGDICLYKNGTTIPVEDVNCSLNAMETVSG